jgi:murein DD-endopeptidase MepM/ murein hydrolase activator NlpD
VGTVAVLASSAGVTAVQPVAEVRELEASVSALPLSAVVQARRASAQTVSRAGTRTLGRAGVSALQRRAEAQARQRLQALRTVEQAAEERSDELAARVWVPPLSGYTISATFGASSSLWATTHTGLDFAAAEGTPLVAIAGGVITQAGYSAEAGWAGNLTVLRLPDKTEIWYAHQSSVTVSPGDVVSAGQVIGHVGSTGNSTWPHLHLEIRPAGGDPVDPAPVLQQHDVAP